jgi:hypothetical protein
MMEWPKRLAHRLLGDYELYRIFVGDLTDCPEPSAPGIRLGPIVDPEVVRHAPDPVLHSCADYAGEGALGYAAWAGDDLVAVEWVWFGERYRSRNFWPLDPGEAKAIQTTVSASQRGRGLATLLRRYMMSDLARRGFRRVYARIWHSHTASIASARRAGWREIAFVVGVYPFGRRRPIRLIFRRREYQHSSDRPRQRGSGDGRRLK